MSVLFKDENGALSNALNQIVVDALMARCVGPNCIGHQAQSFDKSPDAKANFCGEKVTSIPVQENSACYGVAVEPVEECRMTTCVEVGEATQSKPTPAPECVTTGSPDEVEVREVVGRFAEWMESRLRDNDHKGGWIEEDPMAIILKATKKLRTLTALVGAFKGAGVQSGEVAALIAMLSADVANYAMMVADITTE